MRARDFSELGLFVRDGFLDAASLRAVRQVLEDEHGDPAEVLHGAADALAVSADVRRAWEVTLPDHLEEDLLARIEGLRPELEHWCGRPLARCGGLVALRYPPGAFYRTHRDAASSPDQQGLHRRAVSIVVFINSGGNAATAEFRGGALRLYELLDEGEEDAGLDLQPEAGTLLAFPSSLLHEVTVVEEGQRYTVVTWLMADDGES
jgi:predicted 2-oxoglutarate/Fe(II)-dependent dioxygenase YbiX